MAEKIIVDDDTDSIISSISKTEVTSKKITGSNEYADVTGAYPRRKYSGLSGVNKAATGNEKNHVYTGGGDAHVNIKEAIPDSRYNSSQYTLNRVSESPAGHVTEIDDTPGSERVLHMHKTGSGVEMLADGTVIYSSTGNTVRVTLQDEKVIVEGNAQMSYNGNLTLDVSGDFDVKVGGNYNIKVAGSKTEEITGSSSSKVSKQYHTEIGSHKLENIGGTETKQVFGNQNNIVKGYMHHIVEGVIQINSKGDLSMTSENEIVMSSDDMNIGANNISVFGATGTFGGEEVVHYGSTFHGDLNGLAKEASESYSQNYSDGSASPSTYTKSEGTPNWDDTIHNSTTAQPTSAIVTDYLANTDRAKKKVSIDLGDVMKNSLAGNRSAFYGNVTSNDLTTSEARALLKDPGNTTNKEFIGAIISSGKISDKYNNPAPPAIGRILDPSKAKFRGNQPIGQSGKRASKRYAV